MSTMRAKMQVHGLKENKSAAGVVESINVILYPVSKDSGYPADGSDEDNNFARWTPSGELKLLIQNPALFDKLPVGAKFYVDFTRPDEYTTTGLTVMQARGSSHEGRTRLRDARLHHQRRTSAGCELCAQDRPTRSHSRRWVLPRRGLAIRCASNKTAASNEVPK